MGRVTRRVGRIITVCAPRSEAQKLKFDVQKARLARMALEEGSRTGLHNIQSGLPRVVVATHLGFWNLELGTSVVYGRLANEMVYFGVWY